MVGKGAILLYALGMASTGAAWGRPRKSATVSEARLRRAAVALTQTGADFFPAVVREISSSLGAALAFVGEFTADGQIQTVAVSREGRPDANFSFPSHDSPCSQLSANPDFHHADDVQRLFPRDTLLAGMSARGCVGVVLADSRQAPIGVIVAATTSAIEDPADAVSLLTLFAGRVAAEMQGARTERELRQREDHLLQVQRVEAVGRLAGGIAHDFNNLLMIMIGYAEIIRDREGASLEVTELLAAANRATKLTRQLLAFGRRQVLQTQRVDLNRVVTQVQTMLAPLIGANVRLETSLARALPAVEADPGQFEQVLVNLALNARDAMPDGGTLRLETRTEQVHEPHYQMPAGDYVCLVVSDTGIGMSPQVQAHIFEPFFTTKGNAGTGLGLSSVYGIVKQSGGFIWCSSEPSRGTTFTIYLRPAKGAAIAADPEPASQSDQSGSERVLIVDDEPGVRRLMSRLLRVRGYSVHDAEDGPSALRFLEAADRPVDLVVTDVVMPGMSGISLAEAIESRWPEMKLLFVTGYADRQTLGSIEATSRPVLCKPFTPAVMAATVRAVLESRAPS